MSKQRPTGTSNVASSSTSSASQITVEEVARAVTQGVLRAIEVQRQSIGKDISIAGGRFEFLVHFGQQGGGLSQIKELSGHEVGNG
jgi:hypothetical protein